MTLPLEDVQSRVPTLSLSLSRVGVTNVEKVIRIRTDGAEQLFSARLDCFVDLGPHQKGAHMSRFEEVVNDAIGEVVLGESAFRAETLAAHIAEKVRDRQGALRAEVHEAVQFCVEQLFSAVAGEADDLLDVGYTHAREGERERRSLALNVLERQSHDTQA